MTLRNILFYPNPRLRLKATPIQKVDNSIRTLIDDMFETMHEGRGVGLAATQIDIQLQLITMDVSVDRTQPLVLINPVIIEKHGSRAEEEGCISVPGVFAKTPRADRITVKALDKDGNPFELDAESILATCIQHEVDHLEGKLFIDHLSALKRKWIMKKFNKLTKKA
jgi:peptide deformylase